MSGFLPPTRRAFCLALPALPGACAALRPAPAQPLLRLGPASLGMRVAWQQRLDVTVAGTARQLDAVLEVDEQSLRLAVLALGQTVARLDWDGTTLAERRAPGWPDLVSGERILSDLQLMLWPAAAIRAALPPGWQLEASPSQRRLSAGDELVAQVDYRSPTVSEMQNLRGRYRIRVESRPMEATAP